MLEGLALLVAIHGIALHEDFEVDLRGIELGSIDAGELALVAEQHAAAAAHACAVDHDGVEADHGLDAERGGDAGDGAHHGHGTDGEDKVELAAGGEQVVELFGDQALFAIAAVVGHDVGFAAGRADFVFKDHHLACCARLQ